MSKVKFFEVQGTQIMVSNKGTEDYICLTDIVRSYNSGSHLIDNWVRNKETLDFLAVWEKYNNPNFKPIEFEDFKIKPGNNNFTMSIKKWVSQTNATGIYAKAGKYGSGTYAHHKIALDFCLSLSAEFKYLVYSEYIAFKEREAQDNNSEWSLKRKLVASNNRFVTDVIKNTIIPTLPEDEKQWIYANEMDLMNRVVWGKTASQWEIENPELAKEGRNMRDTASLMELQLLFISQTHNTLLMEAGVSEHERYKILKNRLELKLNSFDDKKRLK